MKHKICRINLNDKSFHQVFFCGFYTKEYVQKTLFSPITITKNVDNFFYGQWISLEKYNKFPITIYRNILNL